MRLRRASAGLWQSGAMIDGLGVSFCGGTWAGGATPPPTSPLC